MKLEIDSDKRKKGRVSFINIGLILCAKVGRFLSNFIA